MKDLTDSEVDESWGIMVLCIPKVPLQGFSSVSAESVLALYCNIEVDKKRIRIRVKRIQSLTSFYHIILTGVFRFLGSEPFLLPCAGSS
jgi:hypothetical protein